LGCSLAKTATQLIVCRFLAGLGAAGPLAVGAGTITDMYAPDQRGLAMMFFSLGVSVSLLKQV